MTQEDKQLLLKDLCARLPYRVKINIRNDYTLAMEDMEFNAYHLTTASYDFEYRWLRPYLRPMSSMTEDEKKELLNITAGEDGQKYFTVTSKGIQSADELIQYGYDWEYHWLDFSNENITTYSDWLNEHYFDYRGLIEKGLALEAPKGMYKTE